MRSLLVVLCVAGCGRVGFGLLPQDDGQPGGATALGGGGGTGGLGSSGVGGQPSEGGVVVADAALGGMSGGGTAGDAGVPGSGGASAAAGASDAAPPRNHCLEIPYLAQPANLDGSLDPGMVLEPVTPVGWREPTVPLPSGHSMRYAVGWRPDGIYFFVEVTDPDRNIADPADFIWYGDGVELYVDHDGSFDTPPPDYDAQGTRQFLIEAPAVDGGSGVRAEIRIPENYSAWDTGSWRSEARSFGYVVEAFVDAAALSLPSLSLVAGQSVGIDLAHNVSYPPGQTGSEGSRLSQYFLSVADPLTGSDWDDYPFFNEAVFCTPTLQ